MADALKAFADGKSLTAALKDAGIDSGQAGRLMSDLTAHLHHQNPPPKQRYNQRVRWRKRSFIATADRAVTRAGPPAAC